MERWSDGDDGEHKDGATILTTHNMKLHIHTTQRILRVTTSVEVFRCTSIWQ